MKIQQIQAYPLAYPEPHYKGIERYITLVRIEGEDGQIGWGECISQFREATLASKLIVEQGLAPLLIGANALDVERHWHAMRDHVWWYGPEGIAAFAISAIDMALWDLAGKALGQPVCRLLGGQLHDKVVAMASFIFDMEDVAWTLDEFRWLKAQGYEVVKAGWGMRPEAVFGLDRNKDIDMVRRVREVIGDELELVVDTPGARNIWDLNTAIQRFRDLEPYRLRWIEQPLLPSDLDAHARLRDATSTPIGTGEDGMGPRQLSPPDPFRRRRRDPNGSGPLSRHHRLPPVYQADRGRESTVERPHLEQRAQHRRQPTPNGQLDSRGRPRLQTSCVPDATRTRRRPLGARSGLSRRPRQTRSRRRSQRRHRREISL